MPNLSMVDLLGMEFQKMFSDDERSTLFSSLTVSKKRGSMRLHS
jgi:hypothetical protein